MIVGHLSHWEKEKRLYPAALQTALEWLQKMDLQTLPSGRLEIDGDRIYAMVNEYMSEPKDKRRPEAHRKYADVQCIVRGTEVIGYARLEEGYEILEDKLAEKDVIFFKHPADESDIVLGPGMFGVFFPWDVHRPNCAWEGPSLIRKVILKIRMDTLP